MRPDITHAAAISVKAGTDLSCSIWAPGFNTLGKAVQQGLVTEDVVTRAAERLFTARMQLGMFDPSGTSTMDHVPESEIASDTHRALALKAAEESMVLLKNTGCLAPQAGSRDNRCGGAYGGFAGLARGKLQRRALCIRSRRWMGSRSSLREPPCAYAQGANLAEGFTVPVPRTVFGNGLKARVFPNPGFDRRSGRSADRAYDPIRLEGPGACAGTENIGLLGAVFRQLPRAGGGDVPVDG